jgi:hypothetical protein
MNHLIWGRLYSDQELQDYAQQNRKQVTDIYPVLKRIPRVASEAYKIIERAKRENPRGLIF